MARRAPLRNRAPQGLGEVESQAALAFDVLQIFGNRRCRPVGRKVYMGLALHFKLYYSSSTVDKRHSPRNRVPPRSFTFITDADLSPDC